MEQHGYRLNPRLDVEALTRAYRKRGRVHVPEFLEMDDAGRLYRALKDSGEWKLVVNQGEKLFELDRAAQQSMTPEQRDLLQQAVHAAARTEFQHLYESIRIPDADADRLACYDELSRFALFLGSEPVLAVLRRITGADAITFIDAQATAYGLGHFLTEHDDGVEHKNRLAAYVFNLTPRWQIDWGGLLMFHRADGHVDEAFTPAFNALNIFSVPQQHSVSMVAPFAPSRRYSITGWLRSGRP